MNAISKPRFDRAPHSSVPLFEALVCETHHVAAMSAVIASCINGSAKGVHVLDRAAIGRFLPPEPAILLTLTRHSLLEIEPRPDTKDALEAFFAALGEVRQALELCFHDVTAIGAARSHFLHTRRLSGDANVLCQDGLRAVRTLEIETAGRLPALYGDNALALIRLLTAAGGGGSPCLDENGSPFLPNLPQRRQSSRRTLGQNCRLIHKKATLAAFVKDVSEGGMGLLRVPHLRIDDEVTVELENGRRFIAVVAWTHGEAAGVRFVESLTRSDPLLMI